MPFSIQALKDRMKKVNDRNAKKPRDIWKPVDEHEVRCLQYPFSDDPFVELYFHYDIAGETVLCLRENFDEECAICEYCDFLKSWKDPDGKDKPEADRKADFNIFRGIQPKPRLFIPMFERGKEDQGARFWGIPPTLADELVKICSDTDRQEACAVGEDDAVKVIFGETAYDLKVSLAKPGEKGNTKSFPLTSISAKLKTSPISKDKEQVKKLRDSIKRIEDVFAKPSVQEVERIFQSYIGASKPEAKAEGGTEKYSGAKAEAAKETAARVGGKTVEEAFGDMLASDKGE